MHGAACLVLFDDKGAELLNYPPYSNAQPPLLLGTLSTFEGGCHLPEPRCDRRLRSTASRGSAGEGDFGTWSAGLRGALLTRAFNSASAELRLADFCPREEDATTTPLTM